MDSDEYFKMVSPEKLFPKRAMPADYLKTLGARITACFRVMLWAMFGLKGPISAKVWVCVGHF